MGEQATIWTPPRNDVAALLQYSTLAGSTLLQGDPGSGKTAEAKALADTLGAPFYILHSERSALADKYIGGYKPIKGSWDFVPGPVLYAMGYPWPDGVSRPGVLCCDDVHLMGDDGMAALYIACDGYEGASLTLDTGERFTPKPGYRVVLTMNGDSRALDPAVQDRLRNVINVNDPSDAMLATMDAKVAKLCRLDYQGKHTASFREWKSLNDNILSGMPLLYAISLAMKGDDARCQLVAKALHMSGVAGAADVITMLGGSLPSGS